MGSEHEVRLPGREGVALDLMREMILRGFEAPKDSAEFLRLYCHCLFTVCDPVGALSRAAASRTSGDATGPNVNAVDDQAETDGDF